MGNKSEQAIEERDILNEKRVQDFIVDRKIKPEDLHLVKKLSSFPKREIIMCLHNIFNTYKERSGQELEALIRIAEGREEDRAELYKAALEFYRKYDWTVSWNLIRILEE